MLSNKTNLSDSLNNLNNLISALEKIYSNLGHEIYTRLIKIYEKYCFFGKTNTNFNLDYSQFSKFMVQNEIYDKYLTKTETDIIFNKVKSIHKCKNIFY